MWRIYAATALAALLAGAGGVWWIMDLKEAKAALQRQVDDLRIDLIARDAIIAQRDQAAEVHRIYLENAQRDEAAALALLDELKTLEGRDAPLSKHLSDAAGLLWPNN